MIIGLTGGIGCGKSTVLDIFSGLGWKIFSSDGYCRKLYNNKDRRITTALSSRWGESVIKNDGSVNRSAVADIVFKDTSELAWLNSVFHPLIFEAMQQAADHHDDGLVMCDVPLLYEAGWENSFDTVVSIWCDRVTQYQRLQKRGWSDEEITRRLENQLSPDEKLERAELGIINKYSKKILNKQCLEIDRKLRTNYGYKKNK